MSCSKVRAVTRVATPETEQALLDVALAETAAHVERVVRLFPYLSDDAQDRDRQRGGRDDGPDPPPDEPSLQVRAISVRTPAICFESRVSRAETSVRTSAICGESRVSRAEISARTSARPAWNWSDVPWSP